MRFLDQTLIRLLFFLQTPDLSLATSLSKHKNNVDDALTFRFSQEIADHSEINFLSQIISPYLSSFPFQKLSLFLPTSSFTLQKTNIFLYDFETLTDFWDQSLLPIATDFLIKVSPYSIRFVFWHKIQRLVSSHL